MKSMSVADLQEALKANPETADIEVWSDDEQKSEPDEGAPKPLAQLAESMARRRSNPDEGCGPDPWVGLRLDVEPGAAPGLVSAQLRAWLDDMGRWASEIEISHKTDQLIADAEQRRPAAEATYTVAPDGTVESYTPIAAPAEPADADPDTEPAIGGLRVPKSTDFDSHGWADSSALYQRAQVLIERHPDKLDHLNGMSISYCWKLKGGTSHRRKTLGKCEKNSSKLQHFTGSVWLIWLAADHILAAGYQDRNIERLLFRQLLCAGESEADEDTGRGGGPTFTPPEVQIHQAELEVYGLMDPAARAAAPLFSQASFLDPVTARDGYPDPITIESDTDALHVSVDYVDPDTLEGAEDLSGAGILVHDDGTPLTADEIAEQEAAELRDDPAEDDDSDVPV